jgi:hypothetical protein
MSQSKEKRNHPRFRVSDGAFAFINNIPFTIQNISEGGLQLQTVVIADSPSDDMLMDIVLKNDNFYLQNIPVRLVRFQKNISSSPFSNVHVKCFGLEFGELTSHQKIRLDSFIARSTTGQA